MVEANHVQVLVAVGVILVAAPLVAVVLMASTSSLTHAEYYANSGLRTGYSLCGLAWDHNEMTTNRKVSHCFLPLQFSLPAVLAGGALMLGLMQMRKVADSGRIQEATPEAPLSKPAAAEAVPADGPVQVCSWIAEVLFVTAYPKILSSHYVPLQLAGSAAILAQMRKKQAPPAPLKAEILPPAAPQPAPPAPASGEKVEVRSPLRLRASRPPHTHRCVQISSPAAHRQRSDPRPAPPARRCCCCCSGGHCRCPGFRPKAADPPWGRSRHRGTHSHALRRAPTPALTDSRTHTVSLHLLQSNIPSRRQFTFTQHS